MVVTGTSLGVSGRWYFRGGLGSLYAQSRRYGDAIDAYREARRISPASPELQNNLAWLLAVHRQDDPESIDEALTLAEKASSALGDRNPNAPDTLSVAQAASGHLKQARQTARRARALARGEGNEELAEEIAKRLRRARQRK